MAFAMKTQVRFFDLDGMGHVNNAVFLTYCELARMDYFRVHYSINDPSDFPFIIARAEVDYLRPLSLSEQYVNVRMGVARMGDKSWDFEYEVSSASGDVVYARIKTVQVAYDYKAGRTMAIPADLRAHLEKDHAEFNPSFESS